MTAAKLQKRKQLHQALDFKIQKFKCGNNMAVFCFVFLPKMLVM